MADGELAAEFVPALRAHLDECPDCRASLQSIRAMRSALVRLWASESAPPGIVERVQRRVAAFASPSAQASESPAFGPHVAGANRAMEANIELECAPSDPPEFDSTDRFGFPVHVGIAGRRRRLALSLAGVGAVLLAVGLYHTVLPNAPTSREVTLVPNDRFGDLQQLHALTVASRGTNLTGPGSQPDGAALAAHLRDAVELRVIAPDLSAHGYALVGGGVVAFRSLPAAQVVYRSTGQGYLSVFSLPRVEGLRSADARPGIRTLFASTLKQTTIVAWNDGAQTYAFCAEVGQNELLQMLDEVPTADGWLLESVRSMLAVIP